MKRIVLVLALVACGGKQKTGTGDDVGNAGSGSAEPVAHDTSSALEQRRNAACKQLAPKLTDCALEDAKADLAAGKVKPEQFKQDTAPEVLHKNTEMFVEKCTAWRDISSRQVRVLEVCFKEETTCGPLRECLANLQAK